MAIEVGSAGRDGTASVRDRDGSPDVRGTSRRFDEALAAARREGRGAPPRGGAPVAPGPRTPSVRGREGGPTEHAGAAWTAPALAAAPPRLAAEAAAPPVAALRAAVRALPAVIEAARLRDGARLHLTLGSALGIDLRGGAAGVEVTLHPAAALERAAALELPALVMALRARGVRVARAGLASAAGRPPGAVGRQAR